MSDAFAFDPGRGGGGGGGDGVPQRHPAGRSCPIILVALPVLIPAALLRLALRRPEIKAEKGPCPWCGRPAIVINRATGQFMSHFRRVKRRGGRCEGSGQYHTNQPEGDGA